MVEFYYKNDDLCDPLVNESHILLLEYCSFDELEKIKVYANKVNRILCRFFLNAGITLIDFKLEFGCTDDAGALVVADEISPDSCRLCDTKSNEKFDKDLFRHGTGNLVLGYQKLAKRLGIVSLPE